MDCEEPADSEEPVIPDSDSEWDTERMAIGISQASSFFSP